jgi:hypothetical protein
MTSSACRTRLDCFGRAGLLQPLAREAAGPDPTAPLFLAGR